MYLSREDRETHITYTEADSIATVYTNIKSDMTKLDKLCERDPQIYVIKQDKYSKTYKLPRKQVSFRKSMKIDGDLRAKKAAAGKALAQSRQ